MKPKHDTILVNGQQVIVDDYGKDLLACCPEGEVTEAQIISALRRQYPGVKWEGTYSEHTLGHIWIPGER